MENLKVTIVQTALVWEDIDSNLMSIGKIISAIAPGSTHLIVLPEMFSTGFTMNAKNVAETMDGKAVQWMTRQAAEKKCVITGSLVIKEGNKYYNRLIWMKADGSFETYDKRHLFRMAEEQNTYSSGNKRLIVQLNGWKVCPLICYDLRFPVWSRNVLQTPEGALKEGRFDCLIYVANWPKIRSYAWKHLLIARAIENQTYTIGVNRIGKDGNNIEYSGDSVVLNPKGLGINTLSAQESVETITLSWSELEKYRKLFPVAMDADEFYNY